MVPRRVIADSDDEDGDDGLMSPVREQAMDRPVVEPLSPGIPDTHPQTSDSTNQSFFAAVYDEQQSRAAQAAQQSDLIEQIIRQSQKASGSSGEISLPAKGKGRKENASSATSITSPVVLSRPRNHPSLLSDDATCITTPRKSAPGEWDVPSSPGDAPNSGGTGSSRKKNQMSYGKRRGSQSNVVGSSAAAEMFMGNDGAHGETTPNVGTQNEMPPPSNGVEPSPQSAAKRRKVSLHDAALQETSTVANFYIAQSHLTTMQKLEYQRVHMPSSLNNPKSSGIATIPYSTPSQFASSGPPLPWETNPAAEIQPGNSNIIDITSSPDVISGGHDYTEGTQARAPYAETLIIPNEVEAPTKSPTRKSPPNKRKRRPNSQDEDELAQDEYQSPKATKDHKRRRSEQKSKSPSLQVANEDIEFIPNPHEEPPREEIHDPYEIPATAPPVPMEASEPSLVDTQPAPQPKKRGRKKKQPVSEEVIGSEQFVKDQTIAQEQATVDSVPEPQTEPDKAKKKRGRPRKSDTANPEVVAAPEPEVVSTPKSHGAEISRDELASEQTPVTNGKSKTKTKKKQTKRQKGEDSEAPIDHTVDGDGDASPLKERNSNSRTPSQKSGRAGSVTDSAANQNVPPEQLKQPQAKVTPTPKPPASASQSQTTYRVGLNKRSRVPSLLKSIKR